MRSKFCAFFAVVQARGENNWKCIFGKVYCWPAKFCIAPPKNVFPRCLIGLWTGPLRRISENFDFIFVAFQQGVSFIFFALQFWIWVISNFSKYKRWITLLYNKNWYPGYRTFEKVYAKLCWSWWRMEPPNNIVLLLAKRLKEVTILLSDITFSRLKNQAFH